MHELGFCVSTVFHASITHHMGEFDYVELAAVVLVIHIIKVIPIRTRRKPGRVVYHSFHAMVQFLQVIELIRLVVVLYDLVKSSIVRSWVCHKANVLRLKLSSAVASL
jgi:hypothetical protein